MQTLNKSQEQDEQLSSWELAVSTWVDGEAEIRAEDLDSPYGRQVWDTYHLIGDVMRTEGLAIKPSERFYARLSKAIDDEPTIIAPVHNSGRARRYTLSAVAASAAMLAVLWTTMPQIFDSTATTPNRTLVLSAQDDRVWHDYVDAHRDLIGGNPIRQVAFDSGVAGQ